MNCSICSDPATHYYRSAAGQNVGRCGYHAEQFGYPEYLIELNPPKPAMRVPGYVIQFWDGSGEHQDSTAVTWPFAEELAEWWVQHITDADKGKVHWMMSDAAYAPYHPQFLKARDVTVEVTRVTCLPLVHV
jgi:hypothetical protein